jgi:hypothetical protein
MQTDHGVSDFFASLDLSGCTPEATAATATPAEEVYLLASDDVLAHLRYLPEAFCFVPRGDGQRLDYILKVEGIGHGSFLISFLPVGSAEHVVQVAPLDDVPADLRPSEIACTFTATPVALLTLLAGGAADLRADSLPAMQRFLQSFRFTSYTSFCESRGLTPYVPEGESSQAAALAQARRVGGVLGTALSKGLHSVARASVAASDHARIKLAEVRAASEARAQSGAGGAESPARAAGGEGTAGKGFGRKLSFFRSRAPHSDADPFPAANVTATQGPAGAKPDPAGAPAGVSPMGAPAPPDPNRKWLQGAQGAAAGWLSTAATKARSAVEGARASATNLSPSQSSSPPDDSHKAREAPPDFSFLLPRSATVSGEDSAGAVGVEGGGEAGKEGSEEIGKQADVAQADSTEDAVGGDVVTGHELSGHAPVWDAPGGGQPAGEHASGEQAWAGWGETIEVQGEAAAGGEGVAGAKVSHASVVSGEEEARAAAAEAEAKAAEQARAAAAAAEAKAAEEARAAAAAAKAAGEAKAAAEARAAQEAAAVSQAPEAEAMSEMGAGDASPSAAAVASASCGAPESQEILSGAQLKKADGNGVAFV